MMRRVIRNFIVVQVVILASLAISFKFFINLEIAFLSAYFIITASIFSYKKMVDAKLKSNQFEEYRDTDDKILDPFGFDEEATEYEDIKTMVKEERKKIKLLDFQTVAKNSTATFNPFRLGAYIFLIIGFIALKNNDVLDIFVYLPSLMVGILTSYMSFKTTF